MGGHKKSNRQRFTVAACIFIIGCAWILAFGEKPSHAHFGWKNESGEKIVKPDWHRTLAPRDDVRVPRKVCNGHRPSDVGAHDRHGRAFRQHGTYWSRRAKQKAFWTRYDRRFTNTTDGQYIFVAVWCG